jgi:hypothetical protein
MMFMVRTIPSFRIALEMERGKWMPFRAALGRKDRKIFDEMFSSSKLYSAFLNQPALLHAWKSLLQLFRIRDVVDM